MDPKRMPPGTHQEEFRRRRTRREWRPLEDRSCTDLPWFLLFTVFCVGMGCICSYTIVTGGAARLVFGYDSYGNTCGQRNEPIEGVRLSGLDHRDRHVLCAGSAPALSLLGPAVNQHSFRPAGSNVEQMASDVLMLGGIGANCPNTISHNPLHLLKDGGQPEPGPQ
ncbi:unnamed protein product [Arctogadus glacialis]